MEDPKILFQVISGIVQTDFTDLGKAKAFFERKAEGSHCVQLYMCSLRKRAGTGARFWSTECLEERFNGQMPVSTF